MSKPDKPSNTNNPSKPDKPHGLIHQKTGVPSSRKSKEVNTELTKVQINAVLNADPDYDGDGLATVMDVYALLKNLEHK